LPSDATCSRSVHVMVGIAVERISGHSDAESAAWHPEFCLSARGSELAVGSR
jgi:hypothetical protein